MLFKWGLAILALIGVASAGKCNCDGRGNSCDVPKWAVKKGGLYWAWASPCSGRCSQAVLKYGWRYATASEWRHVPTKKEFMRNLPESQWCAAKVFDPRWNHCDERNRLVRRPDNGYNEQVLVHDPCCDCDGKGNTCDVPSWSFKKNGLFWAWASPCSGQCSKAVLKNGWRYATPAEWRRLPSKNDFFRGLPESKWCGASFFDPRWNHCDERDPLVRVPDNGKKELVLVHDVAGCDGGGGGAPGGKCYCDRGRECKHTRFAHYDRNTRLYWAWASPCSGGCSKLKNPLPYGWRRATASEWARRGWRCNTPGLKFFGYNLPWNHGRDGQQIQSSQYPATCASNVFDTRWRHCDAINFVQNKCTYLDNRGYYETFIVHDSDPRKCRRPEDFEDDESFFMEDLFDENEDTLQTIQGDDQFFADEAMDDYFEDNDERLETMDDDDDGGIDPAEEFFGEYEYEEPDMYDDDLSETMDV